LIDETQPAKIFSLFPVSFSALRPSIFEGSASSICLLLWHAQRREDIRQAIKRIEPLCALPLVC
jgi:hypothetical protein